MSGDDSKKWAWGALLLAHAALTRAIDRDLREAGAVSLEVYDLLLALEEAPEQRMRMCELAEILVFSPSGLTRLIDRMAEGGWVLREPHPNDRRSLLAVLTPAGRAERERSWPIYREAIARHFGHHLSPEEGETMRALLERMLPESLVHARLPR
jgi:DNA-binding MarR family transcriptional regulator